MDRSELQRLQMLYHEMDDLGLVTALHYGPESYRTPEVWTIITREASGRGIAVPNEEECEAYWQAASAANEVSAEEDVSPEEVVSAEQDVSDEEAVNTEEAAEPPPLPLSLIVYIRVVGAVLMIIGFKSCGRIVGSLVETPEGWLSDVKRNAAILACVLVGLVLLRLQIELQWERLSRTPDK